MVTATSTTCLFPEIKSPPDKANPFPQTGPNEIPLQAIRWEIAFLEERIAEQDPDAALRFRVESGEQFTKLVTNPDVEEAEMDFGLWAGTWVDYSEPESMKAYKRRLRVAAAAA